MEGGLKVGREGTSVRDRGVEADKRSCGRIRGRRSLWAPEGIASYPHPVLSLPPIKKPHLAPSATIPQPPLQESTGPEASDPAGQATVSTSPAATPAPEEDILAHMQPLRVQVGGAKHVYQCKVEGCKEGPSTSWATISEESTPGGEVGVLSLWQNLLQPRCAKVPQENS